MSSLVRTYALEPGGPPRLEIRHDPTSRRVGVALDGSELCPALDAAALSTEPTLVLPDGSILRLALSGDDGEVRVTRNGKPLPAPVAPERRVLQAARVIYFVAALFAVLSGAALATGSKYLEVQMQLGWGTLVGAGLFALLGFLTERRSQPALVLAIAIFTVQGLASAARAVGAPEGGPLWPVPLRIFLLLPMLRGLLALRTLARAR